MHSSHDEKFDFDTVSSSELLDYVIRTIKIAESEGKK